MPTCGSCHVEGQSIEHIRSCYGQRYTTVLTQPISSPILDSYEAVKESGDYRPMALSTSVPDSKYALFTEGGELVFYEVKSGRGKWKGYSFLDRLIGSPGDWRRIPVRGELRAEVLEAISLSPVEAARRYSMNFTVCACCGSPLSDPESLARGFGPVCAERF